MPLDIMCTEDDNSAASIRTAVICRATSDCLSVCRRWMVVSNMCVMPLYSTRFQNTYICIHVPASALPLSPHMAVHVYICHLPSKSGGGRQPPLVPSTVLFTRFSPTLTLSVSVSPPPPLSRFSPPLPPSSPHAQTPNTYLGQLSTRAEFGADVADYVS